MNIFGRIIAASSLMICAAVSAGAQTTFSVDGINYKVLSTSPAAVSVERASGTNYTGVVNIPATVAYDDVNYSVTAIGRGAFYNSMELTAVNIGPNVAEIGVSAFAGCMALESIGVDAANKTYSSQGGVLFSENGAILEKFPAAHKGDSYVIPDGVKGIQVQAFDYTRDLSSVTFPSTIQIIGAYAFMASSLMELDLPDSATTLGEYAFYQCPALEKVTLGRGIKDISEFCFNSCETLSSVTLKGDVESIGQYAFFSCFKLEEFALPQSLKSIGNGAFKSCENLKSVNIGKNVESIGIIPWSFCKALRSINVDSENKTFASIGGVLFSKDGKTLIEYPAGRPGEYEVPASTEEIARSAFYYCTRLTEVTIPASVKKIGESAFHACMGLTAVAVPGSEIGSQAFMFCENLRNVTISAEAKSIGTLAFSMCDVLETVNCQAAEPPVLASENVFSDESYVSAKLNVPTPDAYKQAFGWKLFRNVSNGQGGIEQSRPDSEIAGKVYVALDGTISSVPARPGIYVVNTTYTDGTSSSHKVIIK